MPTPVLATVTLAATSGNPADNSVNDFVFSMATFTSGDADDIATALASFYNTDQVVPGNDGRPAGYIGEQMSRASNAVTIDLYDLTGHLDGTPHGSPTYTRQFTLYAAITASELPSEMAVCLSFHGDLDGILEVSGATRPAARRRGRIFLGPLNIAAISSGGGNQPMVTVDARDVLSAAATILMGAVDNGWSVWSRANAALYPVVGGWVDDAFDVQRRRGPVYTTRTFW